MSPFDFCPPSRRIELLKAKAQKNAAASAGKLWSRTATSAVAVAERESSIEELRREAQQAQAHNEEIIADAA